MRREPIDLHYVLPIHLELHRQLINWAKWCGGGGKNSSPLPMFQDYRHGYEEPSPGSNVDTLEGLAMEKQVSKLPEKHRETVRWAYVKPWIPVIAVRRALGVTHIGLFQLLQDGRSMLHNRIKRDGLTARPECVEMRATDAESGLKRSL